MDINWTLVLSSPFLFGALAWLTRSLVTHFLSKDLDRFKAELQQATIEHQIRFGRLHEKQALVIAELYTKFLSFGETARRFVRSGTRTGPLADAYFSAEAQFRTYFDRHRIYLSESLCHEILKVIAKIRDPAIITEVYGHHESQDFMTDDDMKKEVTDRLFGAWQELERTVPDVRGQLEREFRTLLGVSSGIS